MRCITFVLLFVMTACSVAQQGADESLCRSFVKSTLINPETAEFYDFSPLSQEATVSLATEATMDARDVPQNMRQEFKPQFERIVAEETKRLFADGGRAYRLRIKAESRLGTKVTQQHICGVEDDTCTCLTGDEMTG